MVCTCEKGSSRVGQNPLLFILDTSAGMTKQNKKR